jgi:hypothetical protein
MSTPRGGTRDRDSPLGEEAAKQIECKQAASRKPLQSLVIFSGSLENFFSPLLARAHWAEGNFAEVVGAIGASAGESTLQLNAKARAFERESVYREPEQQHQSRGALPLERCGRGCDVPSGRP